jgi:hypothetical protein
MTSKLGHIQDKKGREQGSDVAWLAEKSYELKKHVATIHSANQLTLVQRKIANALLFNAYSELLSKSEHQIHVTHLCELIGYNSHDQKAIKKALVSLISAVIEWNLIDKNNLDDQGQWNASAIISDASIKGAVCSYSYSKRMRELLHSPAVYGRLNMKVQARFKSSYGLALYENCIRYQNISETPWFDLLTFRKLMGVDESKYSAFKDFRKRVIDIASKEVNEHSYLAVDYLLKKAGRKVIAIKFTIGRKQVAPLIEDTSTDLATTLERDFGLSKQQAKKVLQDHEKDYVLEKIKLVKSAPSYLSGKVKNLANYLHSALENDFQPAKSSQKVRVEQKPQAIKEAKQEKRLKQQRVDDENSRHKHYLENFSKLSLAQQKEITTSFEKVISNTIYLDLYQRDGLDNEIVSRKFVQHLKESTDNLEEIFQ